jgi:hypothetical protein
LFTAMGKLFARTMLESLYRKDSLISPIYGSLLD